MTNTSDGLFNEGSGSPEVLTGTPTATDTALTIDKSKVDQSVFDLIGEGKKYKDLTSAVSSVANAQEHIKQLEAENATLRDAGSKAAGIQDVLDALSNPSTETITQTPATVENVGQTTTDISKLVQDEILNLSVKQSAKDNLQKVTDYMVESYGTMESAQEALATKAGELGVGIEFIRSIGEKSPEAFSKLMGKALPANSTSNSQVSTVAVHNGGGPGDTDDAYFANLLATDRAKYYSKEVQLKLMEHTAKKLGVGS